VAGLTILASVLSWILLQAVGNAVPHGRHSLRVPTVARLQTEETRLLGAADEEYNERAGSTHHPHLEDEQ